MQKCKAVIYARYSSAGQRDESIEGQFRECREFAERKGYKVIAEYSDRALSATTDKRPDFQRMIKDAESKTFDTVICWKHDRFARNRYDAAFYKSKLKACGVSIIYAREDVPDGPSGIIIDSVMEGFAEYYSANLSENVKRGLYESALKRQTMGIRLLGYTEGPDKRFAIDEKTAPIVKRIFEEYAAGRSAKDIAADLNAEGYRPSKNYCFSFNTMAKTIRNEKYKGVYRYNDIYDENGIPAIVTPELWQRANDMADKRRHAPSHKEDSTGYILSGKLFCGHCQESMTAFSGTSRNGAVYKYYTCNNRRKKKCNKENVPKDYIEDRIVSILSEIVFSDAIISTFADRFIEWQDKQTKKGPIPDIQARLNENKKAADNILKVIESGCALQSLTDRLRSLEEEREQLEYALNKACYEEPKLSRDEVVFFLESFRNGDQSDEKWRSYLIRTFLDKAYIFDDGRLFLHLNYSGDCNEISVNLLEAAVEQDAPLFKLDATCSARGCQFEHIEMYFFAGSLFALIQ